MASHDSLGDRMKFYEKNNTPATFPNLSPFIVRIDGKAFHTFTKQCEKPFDQQLHRIMSVTMFDVAEKCGAKFGYTQSDEISLVFWNDDYRSQYYFDGKRDKINSVLASYATLYFNRVSEYIFTSGEAVFDCRSFWVPNRSEVMNYIIWREQDAVRNSIQMLAQSLYSHKQLQGKNQTDLHEMCFSKGINWNDLDQWKKNGTFYMDKKLTNLGRITADEDLEILKEYINVE